MAEYDIATLKELRERVRTERFPNREVDARIHHALFPGQSVLLNPGNVRHQQGAMYGILSQFPLDGWTDWDGVAETFRAGAYTGSVDSSIALITGAIPGGRHGYDRTPDGVFAYVGDCPRQPHGAPWRCDATHATIPGALLDALLQVLILRATRQPALRRRGE